MQEVVRRGLDVQLQDEDVVVSLEVRRLHPVLSMKVAQLFQVRPTDV